MAGEATIGHQPGQLRPEELAEPARQPALDLLQEAGLEALSMRGLADRLQVKAASLYWHVRDRDELLELMAVAVLQGVRLPASAGNWRDTALGVCTSLEDVVIRRPHAARLILEVPDALERSPTHQVLVNALDTAGLEATLALETASMMLAWVRVRALERPDEPLSGLERPMQIAIDSGSRGVKLRAGANMTSLIRTAHDPAASAPAAIRGDRVIVRRLRGGRHGELELNPAHPWRFKLQAPTWNTVLDLVGLDVREIHIDSGAARIECILPPPRGRVPIEISSGVVGVRIRRPPSAHVVSDLNGGAVQLRLDRWAAPATAGEAHWESAKGAATGDHYHLRIHSGAVRVTLEQDPSISAVETPHAMPAQRATSAAAALNVLLDGVAARISAASEQRPIGGSAPL